MMQVSNPFAELMSAMKKEEEKKSKMQSGAMQAMLGLLTGNPMAMASGAASVGGALGGNSAGAGLGSAGSLLG